MTARLLILDLDGTILDSFRDIATSCNLLLAGIGDVPLTDEEVRPCIGRCGVSWPSAPPAPRKR